MECRQAFYDAAENKISFPGLNAKTKLHLWSADRPFMMQQRIKCLFLALMLRQRCIYGVQTGFHGAAENKMSFPGLNAKTKVHLWSADRPFMMQQRIKCLFLALMLSKTRCIYGVQTGFHGAAENKMSFPGLNAKTKMHLWSADWLSWCSRE